MSKTVYMIAHASSGDSNAYMGEHTGFELNTRAWWDASWIGVYRANDETAREKLADFMERAVCNGYIGYSQSTRMTLFNTLSANGFKPEIINENVCCDCSSLVYSAIRSIYDVTYSGRPTSAPVTAEYDAFLLETNLFTKYATDEYLKSSDNLLRGDILLKDGHVAIWI